MTSGNRDLSVYSRLILVEKESGGVYTRESVVRYVFWECWFV